MGHAGNVENQGVGMIIGIVGLIGSGKDTIADYLVNVHEFRRDSFAATLKDAVASVFGWDREMLEGRSKSSREWREQIDPWWSQRLQLPVSPRWILQQWGTEVCRRGFHDDIWIASLENKLRHSRDNIVISDCRFPNEIKSIRNAGGLVIRVTRGTDPSWFEQARKDPDSMAALHPGIHASEYSWVNTDFDHVIDNNSTMDALYHQVDLLINDLLRDRPAAMADQI
jgi:hypothetical protein